MKVQEALARVIEHREIFHDEMISLMRQIMGGEVTPVMIAAIIVGLRVKKETIGEIAAAAQVMRELSTKVVVGDATHLVDTCGTGGDGAQTFNISTAAMFVVHLGVGLASAMLPPPAPASPSMAGARFPRSRAAPTSSKRSASISTCRRNRSDAASTKPASVSCSHPITIAP